MVCIGVYSIPQTLPAADKAMFFIHQGWWSLGAVMLILAIDDNWLALTITGIEVLALILNIMGVIGYLTPMDFFYAHYEVILDTLNITEALILLIGAPWHGIFNRCQSVWGSVNNRTSNNYSCLQMDKSLYSQARSLQGTER